MKYSLSPRESLRAKSKIFPKGSGYISSYFPTRVTVQKFSIRLNNTGELNFNIIMFSN